MPSQLKRITMIHEKGEGNEKCFSHVDKTDYPQSIKITGKNISNEIRLRSAQVVT